MLNAPEVVQSPVLTGNLVPGNREFGAGLLSFAYAQIIVRVYANDCARMPKRLFAYTQKLLKNISGAQKGAHLGHT